MSAVDHKTDSSWCEIHKRKKLRMPGQRGLDLRAELVCNVCDFLERRKAELAA